MTNEEAKLVLDNARPQTKEIDRQFYDDEDLNNALDMAIKALEQQPCGDCVSREQALLSLTGENLSTKSAEELIALFNERIKALPPVIPTYGSCKDCKNWDTSWKPNSSNVYFCPMVERNTNPEYYCGDFERKEDKRADDCPLVETQERKVGKWICVRHIENKITYDSWKCSECQHDFNSEEESMVDFDEYNYCPNCGAEMRGAENG